MVREMKLTLDIKKSIRKGFEPTLDIVRLKERVNHLNWVQITSFLCQNSSTFPYFTHKSIK